MPNGTAWLTDLLDLVKHILELNADLQTTVNIRMVNCVHSCGWPNVWESALMPKTAALRLLV